MKLVIRIFNIIYLALCAVACVTIFTAPTLAIGGGVSLTKDATTSLLYEKVKDSFEGMTQEEFKECLDFGDKDALALDFNLSIPANVIINYKDKANTEAVIKDQVQPFIDNMVTKLEPSINKLAEKAIKKQAKQPLKESITDQIKARNDTFDMSQLAGVGITDEYIDGFIDDVVEILFEGGNEMDDIFDVVEERIDEICEMLHDNGVAGFEVINEELIDSMSDQVENGIEDALKEAGFCDEDGNLLFVDEYLCKLLDGEINIGGGSSEDGEKGEEPEDKKTIKFNALTPEEEQRKKEAHDKLVDKITEKLWEPIQKLDIPGKVEQFGQYGLYALFALAAPWLVFAIITFVKTLLRKRIGAKPWIVFVFSFLSLILGVGITIASTILLPKLTGMIPNIPQDIAGLLNGASLSIKTCAFVSSILYLVMIPFSIVYVVFRKKYKKQLKKEAKNA